MLTAASAHQTSHAESLIILCAQLRGVSCRISSCDVVVMLVGDNSCGAAGIVAIL